MVRGSFDRGPLGDFGRWLVAGTIGFLAELVAEVPA